ncbi:AbgT family transporter, partial [Myxococcota bacterium]|nr:AbgT family transporter [Myxococcota bacterium]
MTSPPTDPLSPATRTSIFNRILNGIERVGNALPHPASIFALLAVLVVVASWLAHLSGASAIHPTTLELIRPVNLLGSEG